MISDSTSNEGGLLERVGENPEGLVNHLLSFDKDADKCVGKAEFESYQKNMGESFPFSFTDHDLNGDGKLQFEEVYDGANQCLLSGVRKIVFRIHGKVWLN